MMSIPTGSRQSLPVNQERPAQEPRLFRTNASIRSYRTFDDEPVLLMFRIKAYPAQLSHSLSFRSFPAFASEAGVRNAIQGRISTNPPSSFRTRLPAIKTGR